MPSASKDKPSTSKEKTEDLIEEMEGWLDKVANDGNHTVTRQMIFGGLSGWLTGFLCMKVGKAVAVAAGGGIILIQIANHKGYININWNRINKDVEKVTKEIQTTDVLKKKNWSEKMEKKMEKAINQAESAFNQGNRRANRWYHKFMYGEDPRSQEFQAFLMSFSVGILLGVVTGH